MVGFARSVCVMPPPAPETQPWQGSSITLPGKTFPNYWKPDLCKSSSYDYDYDFSLTLELRTLIRNDLEIAELNFKAKSKQITAINQNKRMNNSGKKKSFF